MTSFENRQTQFEEFANKIKSIFSLDNVVVNSDITMIRVELSHETHCAMPCEIRALIELLERNDFIFSFHTRSGNPVITIEWTKSKQPQQRPKNPHIPNDIPIDMGVGC